MWGEPVFVLVLLTSAVIDYALSLRRHAAQAARHPGLLSRARRKLHLHDVAFQGSAGAGIFHRPDAVPEHIGGAGAVAAELCRRIESGRHRRLDAASLIHDAKGKYPFGLFPEGGEHWNDVGGALAATSLVDEINQRAGREIVPPFTFSYTLSSPASGADRELADLLNVFFPPLNYLTPKVDYAQPASCTDNPARKLGIAIVGDSFSHLPGSILIEQNCLAGLKVYYYGKVALYGGVPYRVQKLDLTEADLAP